MTKGVNVYELMHAFWQENEYEPFSTAEIALFFFLLERANCRRWMMPFKCSTALACRSINVAKQTFLTARHGLSCRGLIVFSQGKGKAIAPTYTVISEPNRWTNGKPEKQTEEVTDNITESKTGSLPPYNIEDNKIQNKDIISSNDKGQTEILSLDELEKIFLADTAWQDEILRELPTVDSIELKHQISGFFTRLRDKGENEREEQDCRSYFINSLRKFLNNNHNAIQQSDPSKRRGNPVTATSARDYDAPF